MELRIWKLRHLNYKKIVILINGPGKACDGGDTGDESFLQGPGKGSSRQRVRRRGTLCGSLSFPGKVGTLVTDEVQHSLFVFFFYYFLQTTEFSPQPFYLAESRGVHQYFR